MNKACLLSDMSKTNDIFLTFISDEQALYTLRISPNGERVLCNTRTSCPMGQNSAKKPLFLTNVPFGQLKK